MASRIVARKRQFADSMEVDAKAPGRQSDRGCVGEARAARAPPLGFFSFVSISAFIAIVRRRPGKFLFGLFPVLFFHVLD